MRHSSIAEEHWLEPQLRLLSAEFHVPGIRDIVNGAPALAGVFRRSAHVYRSTVNETRPASTTPSLAFLICHIK